MASLQLDCAAWGEADPLKLAWLDPPPRGALASARAELLLLGALDGKSVALTEHGRRLRSLPLPPRIAAMVTAAAAMGAGGEAAQIAALIVERGLGGIDVDLVHRLDQFRRDRSERAQSMRRLAQNWAASVTSDSKTQSGQKPSPATLLALAYPERIAKARDDAGRFILANGRGASVAVTDPLARSPFLVVAELAGSATSSRILLAAGIDEAEAISIAGKRITETDIVSFDAGSASLRARRTRRLGAITIGNVPHTVKADATTARSLAHGIALTRDRPAAMDESAAATA